jgi:hypothetical protein
MFSFKTFQLQFFMHVFPFIGLTRGRDAKGDKFPPVFFLPERTFLVTELKRDK